MVKQKIVIDTKEGYEYAVGRGYEPLIDKRFFIEPKTKKEIIQGKFGTGNTIEQNEKFFRWIWAHKPHQCEECLCLLSHYSATFCSHILTRGAFPEFAYYPENINILCFRHHNKWENGDRRSMRIWEKNQRTIQQLKEEYGSI